MKKVRKTRKTPKRYPNISGLVDAATRTAESLCESEGMELVHIEAVSSDGVILRIYIDKPGGVLMEDCVKISRQLGDILDIDLKFEDEYRLEVSSPGIDRPLVKRNDFDRFKDSGVKISTDTPIDGRRKFKGRLMGLVEDNVIVEIDGQDYAIPFDLISKARLFTDNGETGCK